MLIVKLASKYETAEGVCAFELVPERSETLPPFTAGAHIDVHVPGGFIRQYSLCNAPSESHRYVLGVLKDPASRGGSEAMHRVEVNTRLTISNPRNHFPLVNDTSHAVLVAGGIGLTPLLAMAEQLLEDRCSFELHYCVRSRTKRAFADRLDAPQMLSKVVIHSDDDQQTRFDGPSVFKSCPKNARVYVCGPTGFIDYVLKSARDAGFPESHLHREYFGAPAPDCEDSPQPFEIELAGTGERIAVAADESAVEALARHGIDIPVSCEQGICGTCLTKVCAGAPLHRDSFMTEEEHEANDQFTPCCSRSRTPILVIDISS